MKFLIALGFVCIVFALFSALYFIMHDQGKSNRAVYALALRVGFSLLLFASLIFSYKAGWIEPTGIPLQKQSKP